MRSLVVLILILHCNFKFVTVSTNTATTEDNLNINSTESDLYINATTESNLNVTSCESKSCTTVSFAVENDSVINEASPTFPLNLIGSNFNPDICTCNLHRGMCDVNCCCDHDCSFEDKKVFSTCKVDTNLNRDTSFCQYMDYIYINNTPYTWEVNQNGLFCIVKTNLPPKHKFYEKREVKTLEDAAIQKQTKYSWKHSDDEWKSVNINTSESLRHGSNVWIIKEGFIEPFELPESFVTHICIIKKNIRFLESQKNECSQTTISEDNIYLSAQTYFKDIFIIQNPFKFDVNKKECLKNDCLPIDVKLCEEDYEDCFNLTVNDNRTRARCHLTLNNEITCLHLAQRMKYNFYHNGTQGFTRIELFIILTNLSYGVVDDSIELRQEFEINYLWSNYTTNYSQILSGYPGYLIGKPLLMGNLVFLNATVNKTTVPMGFKIKRDPLNAIDNFLALPSNKKGRCFLNNHTHIFAEFGYNMILKCKIHREFQLVKNITATTFCQSLQREIFKYLPISTNLTDINKVMGSFGNANESNTKDWINILSNQSPAHMLNITWGNFTESNRSIICNSLVTKLTIDIFHMRVDFSELLNQEKIVGVAFYFNTNSSYEFTIKSNQVLFDLNFRTEIVYYDITSEIVEKFAEPPSFQITLPHDFFYPFIKVENAAEAVLSNLVFGISVFIILVLFV